MALIPLTLGRTDNEVNTSISSRGVVHHIRLLQHVSPELLLVHQSKMVGFNAVTKSGRSIDPVPREVKDTMLRHTTSRIGIDG